MGLVEEKGKMLAMGCDWKGEEQRIRIPGRGSHGWDDQASKGFGEASKPVAKKLEAIP